MNSPTAANASPALEVLPLRSNPAASKGHMALLVKLTEECLTALNNANKNRIPVKMKIEAQGGFIEVGAGEQAGRFRFVTQQMPGTPGCCLVSDRHKNYCTSAPFQSKIQVQATDKSFAEKAQKIAEEEKRKALKDVSQRHDRRRPVAVKRATNQIAIGAQRPSPSSSIQQKPHLSEFAKGEKLSNGLSNGSNATGLAGARSIVRAEISRKPLRKRVIHLVLLGKFSTFEEVLMQLRKDSVNVNEDAALEASKAKEIVEEVTEVNKNTGRLQLKQSFYNEVDPRWPGFNSEEKGTVRKILAGNMGSTNFAPMRKSAMAPPIAPSASHAANNISSEANGTVNISSPSLSTNQKYPSNASSRKSSPTTPSPNNFTSAKKVSPKPSPPESLNSSKKSSPTGYANNTSGVSEETSSAPVSTTKRKARGPSPMETAQKRVHFSIPDCCDQAKRSEQNVMERTSESLSSSVALIGSCQTSRDWSREFGEARSHSEALKYYDLFNADYPRYVKYFNRISAVANEFMELQKQLSEKPKHHDHQEIVRLLQNKLSQYRGDVEYLRARQMHHDLRAKLAVLKKRIISWQAGCAENEASEPELESHAAADGNLMVK